MSSLNHVVVRCPPLQELGHPRVAASWRWRTVTTQSPAHWSATPPPAPTGGYVHKGVLAGGAGGRSPLGKNSGLFHFYTHFSRAAASRHAPRKRALHVSALWSVFHVGRLAACALVLHCSQPLGHTACQAC